MWLRLASGPAPADPGRPARAVLAISRRLRLPGLWVALPVVEASHAAPDARARTGADGLLRAFFRETATFLIKLPLSRIDPVDIIRDCAKKFHARIPIIRK